MDQIKIKGARTHNLKNLDLELPRNQLIVLTGLSGSGKTTSLYSALNGLNDVERKIITVEDPVEYDLEGIVQIPVNEEIGVTYAAVLRTILRQDPDVIMVGEMRDLETVDTSLKAAETGHIVYSSIHTNDVSATIHRLVSFFPPEEQQNVRARLAENLQAIVSLRLLPTKKEVARVDLTVGSKHDERPGCAALGDAGGFQALVGEARGILRLGPRGLAVHHEA